MICSHCGGPVYLDDDYAATNDAGMAPSYKCRTCGRETFLDSHRQPLAAIQPAFGSDAFEERIRLMYRQGTSKGKIAYRLHCNVELVIQVLKGGN